MRRFTLMRRKLRFIVGEFLIETGEMIRDFGVFVLPGLEFYDGKGRLRARVNRDTPAYRISTRDGNPLPMLREGEDYVPGIRRYTVTPHP